MILTLRLEPEIVEGVASYKEMLAKKLKMAALRLNYVEFLSKKIKIVM